MNRTPMRLALLATLVLTQSLWAQSRSDRVDPAQWAPEDALLFIGVTDVEETWENYKKTADYKAMQDPVVKEVIEGMDVLGEVFEAVKKNVAELLDTTPGQLKNPLTGPLAMYLELPRGATSPNDAQVGITAQFSDAATMKEYVDGFTERMKELSEYDTESLGSHTIHVFKADEAKRSAAAAEAGDEPFDPEGAASSGEMARAMREMVGQLFSPQALPDEMALVMTDKYLVLGASADSVKRAIERTGSGRNLAGADDYRALLKELRPVGNIRMLLNVPRMIELARSEASSNDSMLAELKQMLQMTGADALRSIVGHVRMGASSYDSKADVLFLMQGQRTGLTRVLSMQNTSTTPPQDVSNQNFMFGSLNLNVPNLLNEIERMIRQSDPAAADQFRQGLQNMSSPMGGPPINLQKELLEHMTGPLKFQVGMFSKGADGLRMLLSLGHRNQNAVTTFLSTHGQLMMLAPLREVRGVQLFGIMMAQGFAVAPGSDALMIGSIPAIEQSMESSSADALAESDNWRRMARHIPDDAWFMVYADDRLMYAAMLDYLEAKQSGNAPPMGMDMSAIIMENLASGLTSNMTPEELEQARQLLKYQAPSAMTIATTDEGLLMTLVQLQPEDN